MKVALVGFEIEGRAAFQYWSQLGAEITICDQKAEKKIPDGIASQLGEGYLHNLDRFDIVWRTAGINPRIILEQNPDIADKITTTVNEFLRVCPTKHVIGITGTKGKGTTSTLIAKMLEATGETVFLGGNIGVSPFEFLPKLDENAWVVLELSSFQLADLKRSPSMAVCLMVVPEHLDWHTNLDDYILAKARLFENQTPQDTAIYYAQNDDSRKIAGYSPGFKIPYFAEPGAYVADGSVIIAEQHVCQTDELKLIGEHNWQNVCAALTVLWQITQNVTAIRSILTTFSGLPHRLEFIRDVNNVKYYNDSFAATPDAAIAALDALHEPKVVILGGFDRNLPLEHLAEAVRKHADDLRKVIIIGASGARLARTLDTIGFTNYSLDRSKSMSDIVGNATAFAQPGDIVLLSPGFASFDMFENFADRGMQFKTAVQKL